MKLKTFILTLLISFISLANIYGQGAVLDTVFVKKSVDSNEFEIDTLYIPSGRSSTQVLAATTFLPSSDRMIGLLNKGLSPISFEIIEECNDTYNPKTANNYPKFLEVKRNSIELTIDVAIVANCCHNFLGEAEILGADTLNLVYTSYGGFCSCSCCFTLRYKFDSTMEEHYQILNFVKINGSKTFGIIPNE